MIGAKITGDLLRVRGLVETFVFKADGERTNLRPRIALQQRRDAGTVVATGKKHADRHIRDHPVLKG